MSTRSKRGRCTVCRNPLPNDSTTDKCSGACRAQTVLFPKRLALRLTRTRTRTGTRGGGR